MTNKKVTIIFFVFFFMIILLAAAYLYKTENMPVSRIDLVEGIKPEFVGLVYHGDEKPRVPDIEIMTSITQSIPLASLHEDGMYLLLNVWATWCAPCLTELPHLMDLKQEILSRNIGLNVVALSIDSNKSFEDVLIFLGSRGLENIEIYQDPQNALIRQFSVPVMPTTFLINPDGEVEISFIGDANWSDEKIIGFLKEYVDPGTH